MSKKKYSKKHAIKASKVVSTVKGASEDKSPVVIGTYEGKCCGADFLNNNEMNLSRELFEVLMSSDDYKRAMQNRYYIGFLGHPEDPNCMDFKDACIVMTDMRIEDNGDVIGSFDLIGTPVGQVVKKFIDAGVHFGISIRGAGDVDSEGNVDPETFVFRGFDLVTFPAYDDCVPEFKEIAASSDLDKQVKYKAVCAAVKKNLKSITSTSALEVIQDQFNPSSSEFEEVSHRIDELTDEVDQALEIEVLEEKVKGLTDLYIDAIEQRDNMVEQNAKIAVAMNDAEVMFSRKLSSFKRITCAQMQKLEDSVYAATENYKKAITANKKLKKDLEDARQQTIQASNKIESANLKYKRKMEDQSEIIAQKDSAIDSLNKKLSETVTATTALERKTSNLDGEVQKLSSRVEAAEKLIFEYQQAYADLFANALGVHLENLSITASTSVSDLRKMISGGTSTSNMMSGDMMELEGSVIEDDDALEEFTPDEDGDDSSLITI